MTFKLVVFYRFVVVLNHIAGNKEAPGNSTVGKHKHFASFHKLQCSLAMH